MQQSPPKRSNLSRWTVVQSRQPLMLSMLVIFAACGDVTNGESISGAEVDHGKAGAHAGESDRGGTGGRGGQAGKAAAPSAGSSGRGGSSAKSASPSAGSNAVATPDEKVLATDCEFTASDWLTQDGEQLLVSCENDLGLVKLTGGSFAKLASPPDPRDIGLSSARLLYSNTMQLFSVPLAGGEAKPLAINVIGGLQYSSDRTVAMFERAENNADQTIPIVAVDSDGKMNERLLVNAGSRGSCLSGDGRHLVYRPSYGELGLVDVQDPSRTSILGKGSLGSFEECDKAKAVWSSSSQRFAFFDTENHHVVLVKADGSTTQLGDAFSDEPETLAIMPDESTVLAIENDYSYTKSRTVILGADGETTEIAKGKNSTIAWISHAGSVLTAQNVDDESSPELWLRSTQGTNKMLGTLERCTSGGELPIAALVADGARVAFVDVHGSFVVVDFDSGAPVSETKNVVTVGAACFAAPAWSSDGSKVLLTSCKDQSLDCSVMVMDVATEKNGPTLGTERADAVEFSKDSRYVAYYNNISAEVAVYATSSGTQVWKEHVVPYQDGLLQFHWLDSHRFVAAAWDSKRELRLVTLK